MFEVTDAAKLVLHSCLVDRGVPPEAAFRISSREGGVWLNPDRIAPDDTSYEIAGRCVLIVAKDELEKVDGLALDVLPTDNGNQFLLRSLNPGTSSSLYPNPHETDNDTNPPTSRSDP
jgi:hypothetical protein